MKKAWIIGYFFEIFLAWCALAISAYGGTIVCLMCAIIILGILIKRNKKWVSIFASYRWTSHNKGGFGCISVKMLYPGITNFEDVDVLQAEIKRSSKEKFNLVEDIIVLNWRKFD